VRRRSASPPCNISAASAPIRRPASPSAPQNCNANASGAYTGEVSANMLVDLGVQVRHLGHSERRDFGETTQTSTRRSMPLLSAGMSPSSAWASPWSSARPAHRGLDHAAGQVRPAGVAEDKIRRCIIAYEPIWAIGTGKTATAEQAGEVCEPHPRHRPQACTARGSPAASPSSTAAP
jgi:triosephosphate isomerase